ncbi:MAG: DUF6263 family protein [Phycisphaeraceae bacterium]
MLLQRNEKPTDPTHHTTMTKTLASALMLLVLAALPAAAQDDDATNLRPDWTVGQTATYEFWGKTEKQETAQVFGQERSETTTYVSEGLVKWTVDAVNDDGSATCSMKLERIKFSVLVGEQEPVVLDSENLTGERPAFDGLLTGLVAATIKVNVLPDGSIESVEGLDAMQQAAGPEAIEAELLPEALDFKESASDLATLIAAPAQATPGQTWNTVNTWNHEDVFPDATTLAQWNTTHTFDSLGEIAGVPIATIKTDSDIDIQVDLSQLPEGAPDIDIQITDASGQGEVLFDLSRQEAVARNESMSYTAAVTIAPPRPELPPITIQVVEKNQAQLLRVSED